MKYTLLLLMVLATQCWSQQINSAEYWVDSDPGAGNATSLTIAPSGESVFSGNVDMSTLTIGLHLLGVRFKDDRDIWGSNEARLFYVLGGNVATNLTAAEYWVDTDPGDGNGTALAISSGPNPVAVSSLPLEALPIGLHSVGVRFKDSREIWGLPEVRLFYVLGGNFATDLTAAEYWVDTDPGAGSGTALTITPGTNPVAVSSLPLEALPIGLHSVGVRFKDNRDIWGLSEVRLFYVLGNVPAENIIAAEYWLDSDPGAGNGTSIAMSPGQSPVLDLEFPYSELGVGLHQVGLRFKDDRNIWGPSEARLFYVISPIQAAYGNTLTSAEYFINYDPGPGAGVQIPLPTDGNWDSAFETITDSIEHIPGGWHWIGLRFRDERGVWGSMIVDTFVVLPILTILPTTPPVLNWQSDSSSMYYVHRSAISGGPFAIIDSTTARTYTDIENPPAPSTRFYRITQRLDDALATFRLPAEPQQAKVIARAPLGMSKPPSEAGTRKQSNDNTE